MPLDLELLEMLGRPGGFVTLGGAKSLPQREEVFARLVEDGWSPRDPAYGAELDRLEMSTTRGHCLEPLIMEGDVVYIDPSGSPLPGDVVSFSLSARAAAAQNEDLPPFDARPCKPGDRWLKLFVPYCGIDLLYERYGHFLTTTWAACEDPKEIPRLSPVRNIRRDGQLLFTPEEVHCVNIGDSAATDIVEVSLFGYTGSAIAQAIATATVGPKVQPYTATVTVSADVWKTSANTAQVYLAQLSGGVPVGTTSQSFFVTGTSAPGTRISIVSSFSVAAGVSTQFALWYSSGTVGNFGNASNIDLRVDCVKK